MGAWMQRQARSLGVVASRSPVHAASGVPFFDRPAPRATRKFEDNGPAQRGMPGGVTVSGPGVNSGSGSPRRPSPGPVWFVMDGEGGSCAGMLTCGSVAPGLGRLAKNASRERASCSALTSGTAGGNEVIAGGVVETASRACSTAAGSGVGAGDSNAASGGGSRRVTGGGSAFDSRVGSCDDSRSE